MTDFEAPADLPQPRRSPWLALLLVLLCAFAAAAGLGGWKLWQARAQTEDVVAAQDTLLRRLNRQLGDTQAELQALRDRQSDLTETLHRTVDNVAALQSRGDDVDSALARVNAALQGGRGRAQLVGIEQLLLIAGERAQLAHDQRGALEALGLAQERLGALAEPKLFAIRQALAEERTAFAAVPQPDLEAAALSLSALIRAAPQWPERARAPHQLAPADLPSAAAEAGSGFFARTWAGLREVVGAVFVVRRIDRPVDRLVPAEQEALVGQLLLLKLETARAALIEGRQQALRGALADAVAFLADYYRIDDPALVAARAELLRIAALDLAPPLPELGRSLGLLRAYLDANPR